MKHLLMSEICTMRKGQTINEKDIYSLKGATKELSIPVISSSTENNGVMGYIDKRYTENYKTIGKEGDLSWVTNGYAGKVFLRDDFFLPTEKCGIASIKEKYKEEINSKWLEIYLNSITAKYVVAKEGNGKLEVVQMKNIPIEVPKLIVQEEIVKEYTSRNNMINKLIQVKNVLINRIHSNLSFHKRKYKISDIFNILSGVRITKETVYNNAGSLPCVSAQTNNSFWYIDEREFSDIKKNNKSVIINEPCISWVCVGDAGSMFYRDFRFYLTDNAGVLTPKKENTVNLKWFILQYKDLIKSKRNASSQGQSTLFTEHMSNIEVELPVKDDGEIDIQLQNEIYEEYEKLDTLLKKVDSLIEKYSI